MEKGENKSMTLIQLQQFQAVCQYHSVTKAARALHLTQPTVSASIRELEREFGLDLFHRVERRLHLTNEGVFFLERVTDLLERAESLGRQMKALSETRNHIRIGVPPMIGSILFPALYHAFHQSHPEITVEITEEGSLDTQQLIGTEQLDLALVILQEQMDEYCEVLPLMQTEYVYCVGRHNPLAERGQICFSELAEEQMILSGPGSLQNREIYARFAALGKEPNVLLYSSNQTAIYEYLRHELVGAFLFAEHVRQEQAFVGIPLAEPWNITIGLIWKKGRHIYSDMAKLIQFARRYANKIEPLIS